MLLIACNVPVLLPTDQGGLYDPQHEESAPVHCKRTTSSSQLNVFSASSLALLLPNPSRCSFLLDPEKIMFHH